jgi:hypothetical protein
LEYFYGFLDIMRTEVLKELSHSLNEYIINGTFNVPRALQKPEHGWTSSEDVQHIEAFLKDKNLELSALDCRQLLQSLTCIPWTKRMYANYVASLFLITVLTHVIADSVLSISIGNDQSSTETYTLPMLTAFTTAYTFRSPLTQHIEGHREPISVSRRNLVSSAIRSTNPVANIQALLSSLTENSVSGVCSAGVTGLMLFAKRCYEDPLLVWRDLSEACTQEQKTALLN